MQSNNNTRFLKNFMIGLVASSAGAFIALPGNAMPESTEAGTEVEAIEAVEAIESVTPTEALPTATELETEAMEEEPIADDTEAMEEEPVADDAEAMEEEPVAESDELDSDADTVEAAEIEALSDEAIEASDTMDGDPVVEDAEAMEEEPIADDTEAMEEEPVAEEMDTADFTISELTGNSDSFETLAAAIAAADLTEILSGEGPFTVFAPTDEAFAALPEGAVDQLLLPENKDILVQILTYHVVPGSLLSTDLETGSVATVEGSDVAVDVADTVTVNNANVVVADVEASNGIIHIIDRVIIPPSSEAEADAEVEAAPAEAE